MMPAHPQKISLGLPVAALAEREVVRFFRQRNRVVAAMVTPLVFWLMLGLGLDRALVVGGSSIGQAGHAGTGDGPAADAAAGVGYLAYFFPGIVVLMVLFTAIFTTISVIEDRREGFLQSVLVSPASRGSIVAGKALGGTVITAFQAGLLLLLGVVLFGLPSWPALAGALLVLGLVTLGLTGLGLAFAWPMDSTAGYHAVMNLVLMPMWLMSGAVFPVETASGPVKWIMLANPLTYAQTLFTWWWTDGQTAPPPGGVIVSLAVAVGSAGVALFAAAWVASRPEKGR
ncbi:MAG: ABC transporter permease [Planctomycetota bacterium]